MMTPASLRSAFLCRRSSSRMTPYFPAGFASARAAGRTAAGADGFLASFKSGLPVDFTAVSFTFAAFGGGFFMDRAFIVLALIGLAFMRGLPRMSGYLSASVQRLEQRHFVGVFQIHS